MKTNSASPQASGGTPLNLSKKGKISSCKPGAKMVA
jgi:hypothetical protein